MTEPHDDMELSPGDAAAIDALLGEAGAADTDRSARLEALLAMLDVGVGENRDALIDVTMARVVRDRDQGDVRLTPNDEEALDAWVASGYRDSRVAASLRDRARAHERLAGLVTSNEATASGDLIDATLERVQAAIDEEDSRLRLDVRRGSGRRLRLADVVSVAAVLLISFSVVWPIFTNVRHRGQVAGCLSHFGATASAMSVYAGSNRDELPMATASLGGGAWWDVDPKRPKSNSANLFELAQGRYVDVSTLACPGNEHAPTASWDDEAHDWRSLEEISYSYQIMFGPRPTWSTERTVVLTDRSPVVLKAYRREVVDPLANSPNHGAEGQHMLFTDGSVLWAKSPVTEDGNNVWLPLAIEQVLEQFRRGELGMEGTEVPGSANDVFVGP